MVGTEHFNLAQTVEAGSFLSHSFWNANLNWNELYERNADGLKKLVGVIKADKSLCVLDKNRISSKSKLANGITKRPAKKPTSKLTIPPVTAADGATLIV